MSSKLKEEARKEIEKQNQENIGLNRPKSMFELPNFKEQKDQTFEDPKVESDTWLVRDIKHKRFSLIMGKPGKPSPAFISALDFPSTTNEEEKEEVSTKPRSATTASWWESLKFDLENSPSETTDIIFENKT